VALNDRQQVREQYRDPGNLTARASLHARFSTNRLGPWPEWVFGHLDLAADARVLDVGCGPGWLWRENTGRMHGDQRIVCADLSSGMVTEARGALDDGRFGWLVCDVQALPFADGSFDAVVANHMLYHVPDLPTATSELARVLVDRGRLYAATNGRRHLLELSRLIDREPVGNVEAFGLETGPAVLERCFDDVEVVRHEDALRVTEVEPLVDYIRSMGSFWAGVDGERIPELRTRVAEEIDRRGSFDIQKDAGLITAVRR
jgi:SAM-dependent methyltransferase